MSTNIRTGTFRAFRNRDYTLFFAGQSVSRIGTWMQSTAVSWVVYSITHSAFMLGVSMFASLFPAFIFSLLGGIMADRYDRYKLLLITQTASMIQAILLAILILTGHYVIWEILALSAILGIINAIDVPARQPLVHELVKDKEDLANALALNSSMNNLAQLIGPALSGLVLVKWGAGVCFLLNAVSFVAVLVSLVMMKLPPYSPPEVKKNVTAELKEGFTYLKQTPAISVILLMTSLIFLLIMPYNTLLPIFAKVVLRGDAATFGYISSFVGFGAICSTLFLASLKKNADLKNILFVNTLILGIGLILFSYMTGFSWAMLFAVMFGFGAMANNTICLTIIQVNAAAHMRGRVMSYVAMSVFGMMPLGSLLIGAVSQQIGAPATLLCQGIVAIIIGIVFYRFLKKDKLDEKQKEQLPEVEELITGKA